MKQKLPFFLLASLLFSAAKLTAQDLHFSQFYLQPTFANPAQTGIFKGSMRFAGIYRNQWASVPVDFQTFGAAFDSKIMNRGTWILNGGLTVFRDKAGDAGLSWSQIGVSAAAAHALGENQAISVGFSAGFAQRTFDISGLKFKNQWNGENFDQNLPIKEILQNSSKFKPTISAGVNWHFENPDSRNQVDFGISGSHLNRPVVSFREDETAKLPLRLTFGGIGYAQISSKTDLVLFAQGQRMAKNFENIVGAGYRFWFSNVVGRKIALQFSGGFRLGDALIPAVQIEYNGLTAGLSYDLNISDFDIATQRRGGPEFALVYRIIPVPPPKTFKVCPIF